MTTRELKEAICLLSVRLQQAEAWSELHAELALNARRQRREMRRERDALLEENVRLRTDLDALESIIHALVDDRVLNRAWERSVDGALDHEISFHTRTRKLALLVATRHGCRKAMSEALGMKKGKR